MKEIEKWNFPYGKVSLDKNEAHIWRVNLSFTSKQLNTFFTFLSGDEQQKASRYRFKSDMNNYVASRAIIRIIISRYLNINPADIVLCYNYYGKPFVLFNNFGFNVSHSNDFAIFAISESKMVGVDIEYIREGFNELEIADRFFSKAELDSLKLVPQHLRREAFFNCWTRKEAFIKAKGIGLSIPLDSFDVSLFPGKPAKLLALRNNEDELNHWHLQNLNIAKGYASTLAIPYKPSSLKLWEWNYTIEVTDRYPKSSKTFHDNNITSQVDRLLV